MLYDVPGLRCTPNYLSTRAAADLLTEIDAAPWQNTLKRRVQHYGYQYDYKAKAISDEMQLGQLPTWAADLGAQLYADGMIAVLPDQVIVNEYLPGQGIAAHVDCVPCFGDTIISLSLGSECVMNFTRVADAVQVPVLLEPRSVLVMTGESRYAWKHAIAPRKNDVHEGRIIRRGRRVSITFRKVIRAEDVMAGAAEMRPRIALYW